MRFESKKTAVLRMSSVVEEEVEVRGKATIMSEFVDVEEMYAEKGQIEEGTSRQRSGKGAIRKRFQLQKPRWEKTKLTIRHLHMETYRKPNEQLFSQ